MNSAVHKLWIGDRWLAAEAGTSFELAALSAPFGPRGSWPRAGEADLRRAVESARGALPAWSAATRGERLALCERALERLETQALGGALAERLAPALGIAHGLALEVLGEELLSAREALELARDGGPEDHGLGLFAAHWSDRSGLLFARLVGRLAGGARVVLIGDGLLPEGAQAVAEAFDGVGLPPGVLALLHDDGRTLLRAARERSDFSFVRECEHEADRSDPLSAQPAATAAFGAGLQRWTTWPLARSVHVVERAADPAREAQEAVERALGPCRTLYGQLPGSLGVLLCHARVFAAFSAEFLARLESHPDWMTPRAAVEGDLAAWLDEAWNLGLDEGAAPILGEPPEQLTRLESPPSDALQHRPPRATQPILFTNVDPNGRLIALARPAPLLRLVRMDTDAQAQALACRLAAH